MDTSKLQHLTNDVILKLFWFMLLCWANIFLRDFLTQVYCKWCKGADTAIVTFPTPVDLLAITMDFVI